MTAFEVPLINQAQQLVTTLSGVQYLIIARWCKPSAAWTVDIFDTQNTPIITGIPLVTGANLLEQFDYLGIGGQLIVQSDNDVNEVPSYSTLGVTGHLYYVTTP